MTTAAEKRHLDRVSGISLDGKERQVKTCAVDSCKGAHYAKGLCKKHYQRVATTGSVNLKEWPDVCSVDGCGKRRHAIGLCRKHYTRKVRYGDADTVAVIVGDARARLKANSAELASGCWEWRRHKKLGYGVTCRNGRLEQAHRASWMEFVGEIPDGVQVNHKCHNRACINPDHLYLGDQKQNMADMYEARRNNNAKGAVVGNAVLSEEKVREIKSLLAQGAENRKIAASFGVAATTISAIKTGKTWRHVET